MQAPCTESRKPRQRGSPLKALHGGAMEGGGRETKEQRKVLQGGWRRAHRVCLIIYGIISG